MNKQTHTQIYHYRAFGLRIASDLPFLELSHAADDGTPPDVSLMKTDKLIKQENSPQSFYLSVPTVADFWVQRGASISYHPHPSVSQDSLRLFILGSCMGALLQQRGGIILHGNAVSTDGKHCKIFVGESGAGKSTLASWYYLQGAKILADDVCLITISEDGQAYVMPSYPQLKLWQKSADLLGVDTAPLRQLQENYPKFAVPTDEQFMPTPLPFTEINEIVPTVEHSVKLQGLEKVKSLIQHSYRYGCD